MAFTLDYSDPLTGHPRYNIDSIVTAYGGNKEDVRLIQVLLNLLYFDLSDVSRSRGFLIPKGEKRLAEDGLMGDHTGNFIVDCWERMIKNGENLAGSHTAGASQIDPMRQPGERSTLMHVVYFMDALNRTVSDFDVELGFGRYEMLRWDELVPVSLRNALMTVKQNAAQYEEV